MTHNIEAPLDKSTLLLGGQDFDQFEEAII